LATSQSISRSAASGGRQPLLWVALVFAAGIVTGVHAWRPPLWWALAWIVLALSTAYLLRRRGWLAFIVGLGAIFSLGALLLQVRGPTDADSTNWMELAYGREVTVTAHVIKEGTLQEDSPGSVRQRVDVETELITAGGENFAVKSGLRINVYQQTLKRESDRDVSGPPFRLYTYRERLRFPAKLLCPATTAILVRSTTRVI
jgi:hypothetical protein